MEVNVKYFGMIAERLEIDEEQLTLNFEDKLDLKAFFGEKYPVIQSMKYKIAVNQEICDFLEYSSQKIEIALLPPFAGG